MSEPDLFSSLQAKSAPLADRMRPTELSEVVGQDHILGPHTLLGRLIAAGRIPSMVLWGPPGTGKTTIARLLADHAQARFETLSAVLSGVADLRKVLADARGRRRSLQQATLLFVDEIHRWSKSQQDALLEAVETGVVTLVGATTENPSFELNRALLSRVRVFVLEPLAPDVLESLLHRALLDPQRGLALQGATPEVESGALRVLAEASSGDARRALGALEVATDDARLLAQAEGGPPVLSRERIEEALQHRSLLYDKAGDEHYGVVSAFIKSMRGSDPDAAAYYLVRMLESGEDPKFLLRRMVIFASEDVGNADPRALSVALGALQAFQFVGLPEGVLPMTQAATYLALAPKSNSALQTYAAARKAVRDHGPLPVPKKLLNATSGLARAMGHGQGYKYPHAQGGIVPGESYLPDAIRDLALHHPRHRGAEAEHAVRTETVRRMRRPQAEPVPPADSEKLSS